MHRTCVILAVIATSLSGRQGLACPFCGSSTAEQVRANIFNTEFFYNVAVTLCPFAVLGLIIALIYLGVPWDPRPKTAAIRRAHEHHD